ncbi:MAG: hypothetical protein EOP04_14285 [Proteobacteria bacterium]|nr:MAG: hypothetical protein EOP04_14285 [Pseudomonadota bacterium]
MLFLMEKGWRRKYGLFIFMAHNQRHMDKKFSDFLGLPTDNSSSTNLKYEIIASKFMAGIENHQRRKSSGFPVGEGFGLIGAVLQGVVAIVILIVVGIGWILRRI